MCGMSTIIYTYGMIYASEARGGQHSRAKGVILMRRLIEIIIMALCHNVSSITIRFKK